MWNRLTLKTKPAVRPVSLLEAKQHCRVDSADDDTYLNSLIDRAVAMIDGPRGIGWCLCEQTWVLSLDAFESSIPLLLTPVKEVVSIKYIDTVGVVQTLLPAALALDVGGEDAQVRPAWGTSWPVHRGDVGGVKVEFVAGKQPADINPLLCQCVLLLVGHWYDNREIVALGTIAPEIPLTASNILERFRVGTIA